MTDDRIPTALWVSAHLRRFTASHIPAYVVRKGDPATGIVIVKTVMKGGQCRLFVQSRDMDGHMGWMDVFDGATAPEEKADAYIARSIARDPDIWVIEVEEEGGQNPFDGKVF